MSSAPRLSLILLIVVSALYPALDFSFVYPRALSGESRVFCTTKDTKVHKGFALAVLAIMRTLRPTGSVDFERS